MFLSFTYFSILEPEFFFFLFFFFFGLFLCFLAGGRGGYQQGDRDGGSGDGHFRGGSIRGRGRGGSKSGVRRFVSLFKMLFSFFSF